VYGIAHLVREKIYLSPLYGAIADRDNFTQHDQGLLAKLFKDSGKRSSYLVDDLLQLFF
jgi:hypothetical protein